MRYFFITLISIALCSCGINRHVGVDYNDESGTRRANKKEVFGCRMWMLFEYYTT